MAVEHLNHLSSNRATLVLSNLPNTTFTAVDYDLPGIHLPAATQDNPFTIAPFFGDQVEFDPLQIEFIVDEKMSNWIELFQWIAGNGGAVDPNKRSFRFKDVDAVLTVYNAHNNPFLRVKFFNCVGTDLSGINFNQAAMETETRRSTLVLAYHYYEVSVLP